MIIIFTDEGEALNQNDSLKYIEWKLSELFSSFEDFQFCEEIKHSSFWGQCELITSESEYRKWII